MARFSLRHLFAASFLASSPSCSLLLWGQAAREQKRSPVERAPFATDRRTRVAKEQLMNWAKKGRKANQIKKLSNGATSLAFWRLLSGASCPISAKLRGEPTNAQQQQQQQQQQLASCRTRSTNSPYLSDTDTGAPLCLFLSLSLLVSLSVSLCPPESDGRQKGPKKAPKELQKSSERSKKARKEALSLQTSQTIRCH